MYRLAAASAYKRRQLLIKFVLVDNERKEKEIKKKERGQKSKRERGKERKKKDKKKRKKGKREGIKPEMGRKVQKAISENNDPLV